MYCGSCGKRNSDDSRFCIYCGGPLVGKNKGIHGREQGTNKYEDSQKIRVKNSTLLKVLEIILWVGAFLILLNLIPAEETQELAFTPYQIIFNEVVIFSAIGYIRQWHKNFAIPLVLCALFTLLNVFVVFSISDILLFSFGVAGVILKNKAKNTAIDE